MARVLVIGPHPPQALAGAKVEAAHYRTWQFVEPLLEDGHDVLLCAGEKGLPAERLALESVELSSKTLALRGVRFGQRGWRGELQAAHDEFQPDCVVAVNFYHSLYASRLKTDRPLWCDIYGDMITIQQAACFRAGTDRGLPTTVGFLERILRSGDVFSVCGQPQRHMTVGELAMSGRLNARTFGYDFVKVVLPGGPASLADSAAPGLADEWRHRLGANAFVVLWCGGYNTWTDVETLFAGLEGAMAKNPELHFVSVGACTYSAPDDVYARFQSFIEKSPHKNRFHLLGWRPWSEVGEYYKLADIGLNLDAMHYETEFGTRTRLVEMMAAGLPVVTTLGSELSELLDRWGAASTFAVGDAEGLRSHLVALSSDPELPRRMQAASQEAIENRLSFHATTEALREWVVRPVKAPDRPGVGEAAPASLGHRLRAAGRQVIWDLTCSEG